jgi:phosphoribosylanthranilate isomerase
MIIKVCGMRDAENIREAEALGFIDLMGFIFWPKSNRFVSERPAYMPNKVKRVGVFVNEDIDTVKRLADEYELDYIQLHGKESPEYVAQMNRPVIKAISVNNRDDIGTYKRYEDVVEYFLFDTKCPSVGGSGQQFNWSILSAYNGKKPFLLSGGIGPDDAEKIKNFRHPMCIGIDLNSRFEKMPGLKDINKLKHFLEQL